MLEIPTGLDIAAFIALLAVIGYMFRRMEKRDTFFEDMTKRDSAERQQITERYADKLESVTERHNDQFVSLVSGDIEAKNRLSTSLDRLGERITERGCDEAHALALQGQGEILDAIERAGCGDGK